MRGQLMKISKVSLVEDDMLGGDVIRLRAGDDCV